EQSLRRPSKRAERKHKANEDFRSKPRKVTDDLPRDQQGGGVQDLAIAAFAGSFRVRRHSTARRSGTPLRRCKKRSIPVFPCETRANLSPLRDHWQFRVRFLPAET